MHSSVSGGQGAGIGNPSAAPDAHPMLFRYVFRYRAGKKRAQSAFRYGHGTAKARNTTKKEGC
ncbi:hypothetical protein [Arcticibacter tournemirensis]|uniref:Uncharacterized protein n=1 Tax=Arcticibacter tournemirensis TaxID=699437 RepID=A0A4Q0M836_9SPHI|nr:hypothetical protein [Arcticibacter tournemirensis]RXF69281.1 hypothetical protein EKH83_11365 [Arcticibacter tournemirensis]